ncbi:hypothetical protein ACPW7J_06460 [Ihubacter sp. rT4E-8]|uniref:hypothetical protein n=1 Tax=Ihubacter sp. rT4E-8 TaxID=3242369 RepID=UPI003CE8EF57
MKKVFRLFIMIIMVVGVHCFVYEDVLGIEATPEIKPPDIRVVSMSLSKIKVTWKSIADVDGYEVYRATKKMGRYILVKKIHNPERNSYINTDRIPGKRYYYKVRGYKKFGEKIYYTPYSVMKSSYGRPEKTFISSIIIPYYQYGKAKRVTEKYGQDTVVRYIWDISSNRRSKKFTVKWNGISEASGYQLYMRSKGKRRWMNVGEYRGTVAKGISFDGTKEYEFKIRAYTEIHGKRIYGLFSPITAYEFAWNKSDIKRYMENVIEGEGYAVADTYFDSELDSEIVQVLTPENAGWSFLWPVQLSRYWSFEYATKFMLWQYLMEIHEYRQSYCAFVRDMHDFNGNQKFKRPLYCEVYLLRF